MSEQTYRGSPEHRAQVVARGRRLRAGIQQIFNDVEHWNRTHPTEEPIDPDPDGALRRHIDSLDFMLACEERNGGIGPIEGADTDDRTKH